MYTEEQLKIAETFLGTAVNSGVLTQDACREMVDKLKNQDDVLLTYKEVEAILKVSRSTVERLRKNGEIVGGKRNGLVRFTNSSVQAFKKSLLAGS